MKTQLDSPALHSSRQQVSAYRLKSTPTDLRLGLVGRNQHLNVQLGFFLTITLIYFVHFWTICCKILTPINAKFTFLIFASFKTTR